jgi:hypothetical protein
MSEDWTTFRQRVLDELTERDGDDPLEVAGLAGLIASKAFARLDDEERGEHMADFIALLLTCQNYPKMLHESEGGA